MFGIGQHNRDMAEDYARRGFNALIPNLFWRSAFPGELGFEGPDRDAAWARLAAFDVDAAGRDIGTAVQWLRAQPFSNDKVFALGFCAGGRMAFVAAARAGVDAAVSFYGMGIAKHDAEFAQVNCPVQSALRPEGPAHSAAGNRRGDARGGAAAQYRNLPLCRGRPLLLQSDPARLPRRVRQACGRAARRAHRTHPRRRRRPKGC